MICWDLVMCSQSTPPFCQYCIAVNGISIQPTLQPKPGSRGWLFLVLLSTFQTIIKHSKPHLQNIFSTLITNLSYLVSVLAILASQPILTVLRENLTKPNFISFLHTLWGFQSHSKWKLRLEKLSTCPTWPVLPPRLLHPGSPLSTGRNICLRLSLVLLFS